MARTASARSRTSWATLVPRPRSSTTTSARDWVRAAAPEALIVGPDVALPDGDAPDLDTSGADDLALLGYTSGTTGAPKGAMLTHGNLLASVEALRLAWRWTPDDRLVLALPLFHAHGLCVGLHGTLLCGGSVVLLPRFDVDVVLDAARDEQGTLFFGVPTMYSRLAASDRVDELSRLRLCVSGSAPLPADLHRELAARGGTRVLERYGMTETLMNASNPYDGDRRPGSVGIPLPLVDIDARRPTPRRSVVRGPNIFPGYWERPDATRESFTGDWFHTGDIGAWDDDGYLTIVGRAKELIISGGFNVYPREVEDVLLQHPSVREVAVIGTPSDEWGETVTAVVVAEGVPDESRAARVRRRAARVVQAPTHRALRRRASPQRPRQGRAQRALASRSGEQRADFGEALDGRECVGLVVGELADDDVGEPGVGIRTQRVGNRLGIAVRARLGREAAVAGADHGLGDSRGVLG